eukprot:37083-Chlamydomonas_euryale.AAC.4
MAGSSTDPLQNGLIRCDGETTPRHPAGDGLVAGLACGAAASTFCQHQDPHASESVTQKKALGQGCSPLDAGTPPATILHWHQGPPRRTALNTLCPYGLAAGYARRQTCYPHFFPAVGRSSNKDRAGEQQQRAPHLAVPHPCVRSHLSASRECARPYPPFTTRATPTRPATTRGAPCARGLATRTLSPAARRRQRPPRCRPQWGRRAPPASSGTHSRTPRAC